MIKIKEVLNERLRRFWCYLLCAFSFGWGVGITSKSFIEGLSSFGLWICIFTITIILESMLRKE